VVEPPDNEFTGAARYNTPAVLERALADFVQYYNVDIPSQEAGRA